MTDPRQIIDYAADGDAVGVREAMYSALYDRVTAAIEAKKQEVGATLVGGMPLATEEVEQIDEYSNTRADMPNEPYKGADPKRKPLGGGGLPDHGNGKPIKDVKEDEKMCKDVAKKEVKGHEKRMHDKKMEKEGY